MPALSFLAAKPRGALKSPRLLRGVKKLFLQVVSVVSPTRSACSTRLKPQALTRDLEMLRGLPCASRDHETLPACRAAFRRLKGCGSALA